MVSGPDLAHEPPFEKACNTCIEFYIKSPSAQKVQKVNKQITMYMYYETQEKSVIIKYQSKGVFI